MDLHRKSLMSAVIVMAFCMQSGLARTGKETGGGDLCEKRIKAIGSDLKAWIQDGGAKELKFSPGTSLEQYSLSMLDQIEKANIVCVSKGDEGFPVEVLGTPKTCKFTRDGDHLAITCDTQKFSAIDESNQYVLIHHEYAGLAGLERPDKGSSDYSLSSQISGLLEDTITKRLVVRPELPSGASTLDGEFELDFYSSSGSCERKIFLYFHDEESDTHHEKNEFVVRHAPEAWGDHYRMGSFCRDRGTSDIPAADVASCSTYVVTNTLSSDRRSFENLVTLPTEIDGVIMRRNVSRYTLKIVSQDRLEAHWVSFDGDVVQQPAFRCFYNKVN